MNDLVSIENLIKEAKRKGVNFGKGDPYNRLRYYTKIGWLPHMDRKMDRNGNVIGHYPKWVLDRITLIESLKEKGASNEGITKKIQATNRIQNFVSLFTSKESRNQIISAATLAILLLIFANELEIVRLGKPKSQLVPTLNSTIPSQIMDSGTAFVAMNQKKIYIKDPLVKQTSKIYISFDGNYSPATRYWVSEIKDYDGFTVELDAPVSSNAGFNWWISN